MIRYFYTLQSSRKRTNFDTEDHESETVSKSGNGNDSSDDVEVGSNSLLDEPEEVTANSIEVLRMREMHEKIVDAGLRRSKRKKTTTTKVTDQSADVALDASIFEALEEVGDSESEDDEEDAPTTWKIDVKKSNSRKM